MDVRRNREPVFVDTSGFIALVHRGDRNHGRAKVLLRAAARKHRPLITSTDVVDETITLTRVRMGHAIAVEVGTRLFESEWCRLIEVTEDIRTAAWRIFVRYADKMFSFTDCTSFALMEAMEIRQALTFDSDFRSAGFVQYEP